MKNLFFLVAFLIVCSKLAAQSDTSTSMITEETIFKLVEEMPLFPGCEGLPTAEAKNSCSINGIVNFVAQNLQYPKKARKKGVEGLALINFAVYQDGTTGDYQIFKNPGMGLGEEAMRVVKLMNDRGIKWIPGKIQGRAVNVLFTLPVRFALQ